MLYKDMDGELYTMEELDRAYREYAQEAAVYGEPIGDYYDFIDSFEAVEEEEDIEMEKASRQYDEWRDMLLREEL